MPFYIQKKTFHHHHEMLFSDFLIMQTNFLYINKLVQEKPLKQSTPWLRVLCFYCHHIFAHHYIHMI